MGIFSTEDSVVEPAVQSLKEDVRFDSDLCDDLVHVEWLCDGAHGVGGHSEDRRTLL